MWSWQKLFEANGTNRAEAIGLGYIPRSIAEVIADIPDTHDLLNMVLTDGAPRGRNFAQYFRIDTINVEAETITLIHCTEDGVHDLTESGVTISADRRMFTGYAIHPYEMDGTQYPLSEIAAMVSGDHLDIDDGTVTIGPVTVYVSKPEGLVELPPEGY